MKSNNFNKGIIDIKNIKTTALEKENILKHIMSTPILSPYEKRGVFSVFTITQRHLVYAIAAVVLFLSSGRYFIYAAENSLPGDALYPAKINIVEPLSGLLKTTPVEKARFEITKATKRLNEAEALMVQNKLNDVTKNDLEKKFKESSDAFNANISQISASSTTSNELKLEFDAKINAHTRILEIVEGQASDSDKKEIHDFQQNILQTRKEDSDSKNQRDTINNDNKISTQNTKESFNEKASVVKNIINDVHKSIEKTKGDSDKLHQAIINDSSTTLTQAEQTLNKATEHKDGGNLPEAFSALQKSSSAAQEAKTSIEDGLKIKTEKPSNDNGNNQENNSQDKAKIDDKRSSVDNKSDNNDSVDKSESKKSEEVKVEVKIENKNDR